MTRIGVWNTAFLGDAVLALPLLQTLRAAYPDAVIDFWVRKGVGEIFARHPTINNVYEYDKRGRDKGFIRSLTFGFDLGGKEYSLWFSAHGSLRSALMARWASAKIRVGYDSPFVNAWFYTHAVPRKFDELEEIERLLQLLLPLDLESRGITPSTWPDIAPPQETRDAAEAFFTEFKAGRDAPALGVHPGSIWGTKRWPPEYFAAIAARAVKEGAVVAVFGGPGEEDVAAEVVARAAETLTEAERANIRNLAGTLSLAELAARLGRLDCYATNDSGPMHLAWPQKTPVVAMFGPTVRKLGFFPRGETATVAELPLKCRPCGLHGPQKCPLGHHRCMRDLTPDVVWPLVAGKLFGEKRR